MNLSPTIPALFIAATMLSIAPEHALAQDEDLGETPLESMSGQEIYTSFCSRCHGTDGRGEIAPELIANMEAPPPDLTEPYFNTREKRADWIAVVSEGGPVRGLSGSMPAWKDALSENQIAETVEFLKTFVDQDMYPPGELNFFRSHTVTKAFVEQEALIIPRYTWAKENGTSVSTLRTVLYYANRFANRFQYEVKLPVFVRSDGNSSAAGLGDTELGIKYAFYDNFRSRTILSAGVEASLPTGSESDGFSAGTVIATPYLACGQGIGSWLQLQGSVKGELPFDTNKEKPFVGYGVSATIVTGDSKQGFFPGVEFTGTFGVSESSHSESVIPKLYWGVTPKGHIALSVGYEIPLNHPKPFDGRMHAFLLWDYVDGGLWW